uniref:Uncharacterized protein n=1 Tax=Globodera rostochiensis TaxID=31243 RepID=A0A914HZP8_GLORO
MISCLFLLDGCHGMKCRFGTTRDKNPPPESEDCDGRKHCFWARCQNGKQELFMFGCASGPLEGDVCTKTAKQKFDMGQIVDNLLCFCCVGAAGLPMSNLFPDESKCLPHADTDPTPFPIDPLPPPVVANWAQQKTVQNAFVALTVIAIIFAELTITATVFEEE